MSRDKAMFEVNTLNAALQGLGIDPDPALFESLRAAYTQTHRHYHTTGHINECLSQFQAVARLADRPHEVEIALWFHDAVYDTHRSDNEAQSARWAGEYLARHGLSEQAVRRIETMILATASHPDAEGDTALLLDVDLAILGAAPAAFAEYDAAIAREYAWVPADDYKRARTEVLEGFLTRAWIYSTDDFRHRFEAPARRNLAGKLAALK